MKLDLEKILKDWESDSKIDDLDLDKASLETPKLHSKYLNILMVVKLQIKRRENEQKRLLKDKWMYFSGKMAEEDIKTKGWADDPFEGCTVMKSDYHYFFESDPDLQRTEERLVYLKALRDAVQEIVDAIRWRHTHIRNAIDWRKFTSGG